MIALFVYICITIINYTIMDSTIQINTSNSDTYWNLLKNLNDNIKLELISRLSNSLLVKSKEKKADNHWASEFSGAWQDSRSAEEIIDDIRRNI